MQKAHGFVPRGLSPQSCISAHGPDATTEEQATATEFAPQTPEDALACMFEMRQVLRLTRDALETPALPRDDDTGWQGLRRRFAGAAHDRRNARRRPTRLGGPGERYTEAPIQVLPLGMFSPAARTTHSCRRPGRTWRHPDDGDEAVCHARGSVRRAAPVGSGECRGPVMPAVNYEWRADRSAPRHARPRRAPLYHGTGRPGVFTRSV